MNRLFLKRAVVIGCAVLFLTQAGCATAKKKEDSKKEADKTDEDEEKGILGPLKKLLKK